MKLAYNKDAYLCVVLVFFSFLSSLQSQTCTTTINTYPYSESFEGTGTGGFGAWQQDTGDNGDWELDTNQSPSGGTGPFNASDLTYYIYTEATTGYTPNSPGSPNQTAYLNSPCFDLTSLGNPEFLFDYHMFGANMGTLKIQVSTDNGATWNDIGWTQTGQIQMSESDPWSSANINLSPYIGQTIKLRFHGTTGSGYQSDMAVDNIELIDNIGACSSVIASFPYTQGFEGTGSGGIGDWVQNTTDDDLNWSIDSGGTPSGNTGPSNALGAAEGTYYLFTEASGNYFQTHFLESPCFNLSTLSNPEFSFSYHMFGADMGTLKIQISTDDGASYSDIGWSLSGQQQNTNNTPWNNATIDLTSYAGQRIILRFHGTTGSWYRGDMCIDNVLLQDVIPAPEIDVIGDVSITNGDTTPSTLDGTDFGTIDISSSATRSFTIENTGTTDLNLTNPTPYIVIGGVNAGDFSVSTIPSNIITPGNTTTFNITFNPTNIGLRSAVLSIANNDTDENPYTFNIEATAQENFFDSDGDGILDNIDIDDDNDGILDVIEESNCNNSAISLTANYKFLNETFGTGDRTTINTTYNAITTYCYEDGSVGTNTADCGSLASPNLGDGEYTVYSYVGDGDGINDTPNQEVASWVDQYWYLGEDHTPGDTEGRMALFNASYQPGVFYTATITGAIPNVPVTYSFWVLNLDRSDAPGIATRLRPNILVEFRDASNNLLTSITTGDIAPTTAGNNAGDWYQFTADLTFNVSEFFVYFINNETGGAGNDLAIDDIEIAQKLCDTDGDAVADVFDLDSDNDGLPDVVESGLGNLSNGNANLFGSWVDTNSNGMHDSAEGFTILDTDSDGIPNYIDLDSDNDTIFDVDESGAGNTADLNYQNGDGDIDGDGVGDGIDSDYVRQTDTNNDGIIEYYADGILDIYDYFNGVSFNTAYGNSNQGNGNVYYVADSDSDGIPDYMDVYNNVSGVYDIDTTLYANLDADNDGIIDDNNDADDDGIMDLFDTDDTILGSPRDIDQKLFLHFDGRNDYVEDTNIISGWSEATMMGWIKIDPSGSGNQTLMGQNEFSLELNASRHLLASANGNTITDGNPLNTNQWIHVASTYSNTDGVFRLFVNGEEVASAGVSSNLSSDTSNFTFGKEPGSNSKFFAGNLDEVRILEQALDDVELQKMVYQEIENNTMIRGSVVPKDIVTVPWSNLRRYFKFDNYKGDITDDLTTPAIDTGTGAKLYNIKVVDLQTAPMPFVTQQSGSLPTAVNIPLDGVNGNDAITYDWSIVRVEHDDVFYNADQGHLALFINQLDSGSNPIEFSVLNDSELNVSWYLDLDGFIDLEGESQLVQGDDSELDVSSSGRIERDQQGTSDLYTYNYWSSPVSLVNTTSNNTNYTIANILRDGTTAATPANINFIGGYDGSNTSPISIADYWIYKFVNAPHDDYSSWQQVRSTGVIAPGEGFTLKGPGTGTISTPQNYVFDGKPNNGDISLNITAGYDYLVGNPYPSAIDAYEFLNDNPLTGGTLYFWEHWGGGSHYLNEYQGGYAQYNYSGGTGAASYGTNDPDVGTGGTPTKLPGQYIPVSQGFFVAANATGTVNFENDQRVFVKEGASSTFVRSTNTTTDYSEDGRMKFRIGFNSYNQVHRQLLLTIDENATSSVDWGYDGTINEQQIDDMYWIIENEKYVIQGTNAVTPETIVPLGIHVRDDGLNSITIDYLENVPNEVEIYVLDNVANTYQNLKVGDYEVFLTSGEYLDRFSIVFTTPTLSNESNELEDTFEVHYSNSEESIIIINPSLTSIKDIEIFNILGQSIKTFNNVPTEAQSEIKVNNLSTGTYIIKLNAEVGTISKKVLVN